MAIENFEKALERNENEIESLYELARVYERLGEIPKAQEYYRRVVEVDRFSILGKLALQRLEVLKGTS
jgi:Tfp pilus assembly protein PilF